MKLIEAALENNPCCYSKEEIAEEHCPMEFGINNAYYPYKAHKEFKNDCKYRYIVNQEECNKCWNRECVEVKSDWEELRDIVQDWIKERGITKEELIKITEEVKYEYGNMSSE